MTVDLLTLSIALSLANVLQCAALIGLALANRGRVGPVWWAAGMGVLAFGLLITTLRDVAKVPLVLHAVSNAMVGGGMLLLYHGVEQFFGDRGHLRRLLLIWLLILIANLLLASTGDMPPLRRILFSVVVAICSLLIGLRFLRESRPDFHSLVLFLAIVFFANGVFFALRGISSATEVNWLVVSPPWQTATYLIAIATTTLWTFGLILLVNRELVIGQRDALQQLEHVFGAQPDAVLLSRLTDGVFVKVNRSFTTISGYSAEEVLGKDGLTLNIWRSPEDRRHWVELMRRDGYCVGLEFQFRRRDGELRTCLLSSQTVMIRGVPHAISIIHDITERKQMEEALRRSDARYRLIAENATDVIWLLDTQTAQFTFFSPSVSKLIGYSATEALAFSFTDFLAPNSARHVQAALDDMLHEWDGDDLIAAPPWTAEIDLVHRDGRIVHAEIVTSFVRDEEGRLVVLGVARDITVRKQAEIELRLARQQAEAANRAKSTFLTNVSHELRTPLHAVLGFAQLLGRDSNLTATQREYLDIINRSGEHLLKLINDVLDLAKIEAGRYTYTAAPLDVRQLIADLQTLFRPRAAAKQLCFTVTCAPEIPPVIVSDEAKVRQILINLLSNAIKFTNHGMVQLRVELAQSTRMLFVVEDTGIGISPLDQPQLFRPFFQGQQSAPNANGVGLGLSISYELARLMGGDLTVYSEGVGCGARCTLALPLQTPNTAALVALPEKTPALQAVSLRAGQPIYRMLVADDQPASALLLVTLLHRLGFVVQSVADGQAALAVWRVWQPHMIWLDVRMPRVDGLAVARQIRDTCTHTPGLLRPFIVAMSAHVFGNAPSSVLEAGCDDFLVKPFREGDVVRLIEQHLHVQFEYAEPAAFTMPVTAIDEQGYYVEWRQALLQAAREANFRRLQALIAQIESDRPDDARQLHQWIESFDYQAIIVWAETLANVQPQSRVVL
ncbi:PAS domain S-box protein [Chloroflexus sp.]|uniref:PAS domain S-box protein n=1 Tax=Chloroflexus sp. TaxID=1904827 RepID=UPI002ACDCB3A|nr:PAS domain S-box protein [Chloroflexus sp.]